MIEFMGQFDPIHSLIASAAAGVITQVTQKEPQAVFEDTRIFGEILVRMDFTSKFKGRFWFIYERGFCMEMACGFSGMSTEEMDDDMLLDTMKEICNMLSSSILLKFDSKGNFKLEVPVIYADDQVIDEMGVIPMQAQTFLFKVGEQNFNIVMSLEKI